MRVQVQVGPVSDCAARSTLKTGYCGGFDASLAGFLPNRVRRTRLTSNKCIDLPRQLNQRHARSPEMQSTGSGLVSLWPTRPLTLQTLFRVLCRDYQEFNAGSSLRRPQDRSAGPSGRRQKRTTPFRFAQQQELGGQWYGARSPWCGRGDRPPSVYLTRALQRRRI